uniref:Glutaredoxin-related protein 5, mitochondrial n=1 Tax=Clastoptera arizonana TaxID=38151 RepID=A0A1B6C694_9HEMI
MALNIARKSYLNLNILRAAINVARYSTVENTNLPDFDKLVKNNKVVVFMKGVPEEPRCGFSNAVVQILRMHGVTYDSHDVLKDDAIRNGVKTYTNWPTIPQVFINGEFVGGCDIILQLHQSGDLIQELEKAGIKSALLNDKKDSTTSPKEN